MAAVDPRTHPHSIAVLAYAEMSLFEMGIVTEVFGVGWPGVPSPWYELAVCAEAPGSVPTIGGATLHTPHDLETLAAADTVIIPSVQDVHGSASPRLRAALRRAHARGARIVSICSGAFVLADAGLLDGRRATTHWMYAGLLRERYPGISVDAHPLFIDEGTVLTSAGSAAGLDLCLYLVRRDFGGQVANRLARRLVAQPFREGGQAQYIEMPLRGPSEDSAIARSMDWALRRLDQPLTVAALARTVNMSPRSYLRHFTKATGTSPIRWLIAQRIEASLALLETTGTPIEEVALAVGFQTAATYRHHFTRQMTTSPSAYRRDFRGEQPVTKAPRLEA